jgi:hypothetical protein
MKTYDEKQFLLPDSINSCASYHGKIYETGEYRFRIHDCITGICLRGKLDTREEIIEALRKLETLITGAKQFQDFIYQNYLN